MRRGELRPADAGHLALWRAQERLEEKRARLGVGLELWDHARRGGRTVRCIECRETVQGLKTSSIRRLRSFSCPECGGRLREIHWPGWLHMEERR